MVRSERGGSEQERAVEAGVVNLTERVTTGIESRVARIGRYGTPWAILVYRVFWAYSMRLNLGRTTGA